MRYTKREIVVNDLPEYQSLFQRRGLNKIIHYKSGGLSYPDQSVIDKLTIHRRIWKHKDAFWKYSSQFYDGRADLWWVIAFFNNVPTDAHVKIGHVIFIPTPLETVLSAYGV